MTQQAEQQEKLEFKTELKQLLHIITHSLYSNREIFLRELVSNASDAMNKLKYDSLEHEDKLEGDKTWKIKLIPDAEKKTLTICDNGIGMSRETIVDQLGTIARSGTKAFLEQLKQQQASERPALIGQFGVGFYSAFMVADQVTVRSRLAGEPKDQGVEWVSDGQGEYTVQTIEREKRGTEIVLHLKDDALEFLTEHTLRDLVRRYSNFLEHPIVMDVEKSTEDGGTEIVEETLNSRDAIWLRSRSQVKDEEYTEFYRQLTHNQDEPTCIIHYSAEGVQEFKVLLFIPTHRPFDLKFGEPKLGPRLYIQRVLIMENCEELLPPYLRFVRGVVDSSDLPLNISRELLQQNRRLEHMQKDLVKEILKELRGLKEDDYEKYVAFFRELGVILKEGVSNDYANRDTIADLLLFESIKTEEGCYTTLEQYVEAMPEEQKEIYYISGESKSLLARSPHLEAYREKGYDVLLLTDPVDEFVVNGLREYKEKPLKAADQGEQSSEEETIPDEAKELFRGLIDTLKEKIPEVSDVRLTMRLRESACCLVSPEGAMTANMERLMRQMGETSNFAPRRILELNPQHQVMVQLLELHDQKNDDPRIETYARLLYDQAVLSEGSSIQDPVALARRINELIVRDTQGQPKAQSPAPSFTPGSTEKPS